MVSLFKTVLYTSFMGSIVAIILISLKAFLKDKVSASWHYYIWFLLMIRLILPYAPESHFSIFNLFPKVTQDVEVSQIYKTHAADIRSINSSIPLQESALAQDTDSSIDKPVLMDTPVKEHNYSSFIAIVSMIWIVAAGAMLLYITLLNIGFYLSMRKRTQCLDDSILKVLEECKSLLNVNTNIPVIYIDNKPPFLLGIFRPKLIIPTNIFDKLSSQDQRYILLHEISHHKRRDILVNSIMLIIKSIHWFNPIIWYACSKMQEDCEIACDASVLSYLEPGEYKKYGETTIDLLKMFSKSRWIPGTAGISGNGSGIKRRIHMLTKFRRSSWVWTLVALVVFLTLGFVGLTNSKQGNALIPLKNITNELSPVDDAEGEGIVVTLGDRPGLESETDVDTINNGLVHASDVRWVIKELRTFGADAVSVNDIRLTKYSYIDVENMYINVDGNKLKPPFVIKAICNFQTMFRELTNDEKSIMGFMKFRKLEVKIEKMQNLYIPKQGEYERKLHETRAKIAKNIDITKEPDETSPFKKYYAFGFYNFWEYPYVIYNNQKYKILIQDNVPEGRVGKVLGNVKSYYRPSELGEIKYEKFISNGVDILSIVDTDGYSNYLDKGASIFKLKWNSDSKIIIVDDNGILKRAVISEE